MRTPNDIHNEHSGFQLKSFPHYFYSDLLLFNLFLLFRIHAHANKFLSVLLFLCRWRGKEGRGKSKQGVRVHLIYELRDLKLEYVGCWGAESVESLQSSYCHSITYPILSIKYTGNQRILKFLSLRHSTRLYTNRHNCFELLYLYSVESMLRMHVCIYIERIYRENRIQNEDYLHRKRSFVWVGSLVELGPR